MGKSCGTCEFIQSGSGGKKVCIRYPRHFIAIIPVGRISTPDGKPVDGSLLYGFTPVENEDKVWCGEWKPQEGGV